MPSSPFARSSAKRREMRVELEGAADIVLQKRLKQARIRVLVAAAREIEDDEVIGRHSRHAFDEAGDSVRGLERRNDAFRARKEPRGVERCGIGHRAVFSTALLGEPGVLWTDSGIVKTRGNGVRRGDLAIFGLQNVRVGALQNAGARSKESLCGGEARGVLAELTTTAAGFDSHHPYGSVGEKLVEEADGVRAAADASEKMRGQALFCDEDLLTRFAADHGLKIAHHRGIGMCAENGAEKIVRVADVGYPV